MRILSTFFAAAILTAACNSADGDKAQTGEQQDAAVANGGNTFSVDTNRSTLTWTGYKPGGEHNGTFQLSGGSITAADNGIAAGNFTINILSLNNADLSGEDKANLEGHLKSGDFFQADQFPTANFVVTSVQPYSDTAAVKSKLQGATHLISGNLTMKDQTKNVTFPAIVNISDSQLTATADFDIDRTQWGLNYKGPNNPQDWVIRKEVNIKLNLVANK